jgi:hypothetical protein
MVDDKTAKERFVSGHAGTTMGELMMTTLLLPVCLSLRSKELTFSSFYVCWATKQTNYFCRSVLATFITRCGYPISPSTGSVPGFMLDLFFIVLPTLVSQTFTQAILPLMILQVAFTACLLTISWVYVNLSSSFLLNHGVTHKVNELIETIGVVIH